MFSSMGCLKTRPPDVAAPVCAWHARARSERALLGYHGRVLVSARMQELKSPPVGGQAQLKAGAAAQGIGSLGAREGGGSCCMMEFVRRQ